MDDIEKLMKALDLIAPDWAPKYADQQDLKDFARAVAPTWSDSSAPGARIARAMESMRSRVARDLYDVLRAGVEAQIVVIKPVALP
jgi:hypothetical protein